jgi:apolipoprotein D and lipocalin family protein
MECSQIERTLSSFFILISDSVKSSSATLPSLGYQGNDELTKTAYQHRAKHVIIMKRMTMKRLLLLPIILLTLVGCSRPYPPLATVTKVDIEKYLGTWYEIARYEHFFEKGCSNVTATYTLKDNADIKVINRCSKDDARLTQAIGVAHATDESNSKLKVSFFRPFYGDYWIIMLDEQYRYAVVGDPSREYLWILSRTPTLDTETTQMILERLPEMGYTADKLIWTPQGV